MRCVRVARRPIVSHGVGARTVEEGTAGLDEGRPNDHTSARSGAPPMSRRAGAILGALLLLIVGTTVAYANLVVRGIGFGTARTISAVSLTVTADTGHPAD